MLFLFATGPTDAIRVTIKLSLSLSRRHAEKMSSTLYARCAREYAPSGITVVTRETLGRVGYTGTRDRTTVSVSKQDLLLLRLQAHAPCVTGNFCKSPRKMRYRVSCEAHRREVTRRRKPAYALLVSRCSCVFQGRPGREGRGRANPRGETNQTRRAPSLRRFARRLRFLFRDYRRSRETT